ncbi:MAG: hypothetical protein H8E09_00205 [Gammaproteobacteria bacterium]|nr:hypothetical protein [Gammaproteobacteria bacterium]
MEIFKCLLSNSLTAQQITNSVSIHAPSTDQSLVLSILQELQALELIQPLKT